MKKSKQKGFTLVELLVVITIIGIISLFVFPSIRKLQLKNSEKKYLEYKDAIEESGHIYTNSYEEDMFGILNDGCYIIEYEELLKKNLIQKYEDSEVTCNNEDTFIKAERKNGKLKYTASLKCTSKKNNTVIYRSEPIAKCDGNISKNDNISIDVTIKNASPSYDGLWSKAKEVIITIKSEIGFNSNVSISYGWNEIKNGKPLSLKKHDFKNNYGEKILTYKFIDDSNKNGEYYFFVKGANIIDVNGKFSDDYNAQKPTKFDSTSPNKPVINNPTNSSWVGKNYVDGNKYVLKVNSSDEQSGVAYYQYRYPNSSTSAEKQWITYKNDSDKVMSGDNITTMPFKKNRNEYVEIRACDYANNCSLPEKSMIKIDTILPECNITGYNKNWVNYDINIKVSCADNESGCKTNPFTKTYTTNINKMINVGSVYDNAGNERKCISVPVKIDKTAPTCKTSTTSNNWTNSNVTITGTCSDNESGCAQDVVRKTFTTEHNKLEVPGIVKDNAGNSATCPGTNVNIDKTNPTVSYSKNGGTYNTKQSVTITASDNNFSSMDIQVNYNGTAIIQENTTSKTYNVDLNKTGSYTIYTKVYDHAGNKNHQNPENKYGWYYQDYQINLYNCNGIGGTLTKTSNGNYICVKKARYKEWTETYTGKCPRNVKISSGKSCSKGWYCATGWAGPGCYETRYVDCEKTRTKSDYVCDSWNYYNGSGSSKKCYKNANT